MYLFVTQLALSECDSVGASSKGPTRTSRQHLTPMRGRCPKKEGKKETSVGEDAEKGEPRALWPVVESVRQ